MARSDDQDLDWRTSRETALNLAIKQDDLVSLRKWSVEPGGFGTNELRQKVWPYLLQVGASAGTTQAEPGATKASDDTIPDDTTKGEKRERRPILGQKGEDVETAGHQTAEEPHREERQVGLDTNRSFVHYPEKMTPTEKKRLQSELNELIMTVLRRHTGLSYFQGYHDIISVLYLSFFPYIPPCRQPRFSSAHGSTSTSRSHSRSQSRSQSRNRMRTNSQSNGSKPISRNGSFTQVKLDGLMTVNGETRIKPLSPGKEPHLTLEEVAQGPSVLEERPAESVVAPKVRNQAKPEWAKLVDCCEALSLLRIRDGMGNSLGPVVGYLRLLKRLTKAVDPEVAHLVNRVSPTPYFALSWMLTLFSHDCNTFVPVQRIFDYLLCRNPAIVIYLGVALIVLKKERLMSLKDTLDEDPGVLHTNLSLLPPLIADDPEPSPEYDLKPAVHLAPRRRDSYLDPSEPNPLTPVVLSELFRLTDSLWERFPLDHPKIRASEVMGDKSVIFTYPDGVPGPNDMDLEFASEWVRSGVDEEQVVVDPPPQDSEEEQDDDPVRYRPSRKQSSIDRRRFSKTTLTLAVVSVAIGIAIYRGRTSGQKSVMQYVMLRLIDPWRKRIEMQRVWQGIRSTGIEGETLASRVTKTLYELAGWP